MNFETIRRRLGKANEEKAPLVATYAGIPVTDPRWTREELIQLCNLFSTEWDVVQQKYYAVLKELPSNQERY